MAICATSEQNRLVLFWLDYTASTGFGHLKRSVSLAREMLKVGWSVRFYIESDQLRWPEFCKDLLPYVQCVDHPFKDIKNLTDLPVLPKDDPVFSKNLIVVRDSYILSECWNKWIVNQHHYLVAFDELGTNQDAHMVINYSPEAWCAYPTSNVKQIRLIGWKYFVTDLDVNTCRHDQESKHSPDSMIFHLGASGKVSDWLPAIKAFYKAAMKNNIECYLLDNGREDLSSLLEKGDLDGGWKLVKWLDSYVPPWGDFDLVVGPASTSMYESILMGCLPISFAISSTQKDRVKGWEDLGHTLHISNIRSVEEIEINEIVLRAKKSYISRLERIRRVDNSIDLLGKKRIMRQLYQQLEI